MIEEFRFEDSPGKTSRPWQQVESTTKAIVIAGARASSQIHELEPKPKPKPKPQPKL
jgi:hypothetical protein